MGHDSSCAKPIDDRIVDEIARDASACRRSVIRRLAGLTVRGLAGVRIERALAARGLGATDARETPPPEASGDDHVHATGCTGTGRAAAREAEVRHGDE